MLEFFRQYQRYFFFVITFVLVFSFVFFGTYSTFADLQQERPDRAIGEKINGSSMMLSEVQKLSRFIATDREDTAEGRGAIPNLCNDGVIRHDLIKDGLADLIVAEYFDLLKTDLESRLEKIKRFKPYAHPEAPFLSAKAVWDHLVPGLNAEIAALQGENGATFTLFSRLEKLYQMQQRLAPEMLRQILIYQHRQYPSLPVDQRLSYEDLSLFGFHSSADWFGHNFVDLAAEFILNAAVAAEEKGYQVSLEEAKGDLIHHFQESMQKWTDSKGRPEISFQSHLRRLGFDERDASEVWRKVLLFRKYLQDIGSAAFIDRLPYKDFASYAKEEAIVQSYCWPISIRNGKDLAELQFYMKAITAKEKNGLPLSLLSADEVEKKYPQLVQTTYKAQIAEVPKKQIALKASIKQVWDWETEEVNWPLLKKEFSLPDATNREERFKILERIDVTKRAQVDQWVREKLVDQNPSWVEEALAAAPLTEKSWAVAGNEKPEWKKNDVYYRVENLEKVKNKEILLFSQARGVLSKLVSPAEGDSHKEKNPFVTASKEALAALQKNPQDPRWVRAGQDPILDQFKLERKEQAILRTSKEDWMKEQAFLMLPNLWSPIHLADNGDVVFFYLQEKRANNAPILDQLTFGKETLAADAKAYVTEKLLKVVKKRQAIVIPIQKEDE